MERGVKGLAATLCRLPGKSVQGTGTATSPGLTTCARIGWALAARQELMRRAIPEARFARIEGVAAREPLTQDNPADPRNRRISILLLR